jgi:ubiquinone/menaquinone biosynthesis C-methylase UbiE
LERVVAARYNAEGESVEVQSGDGRVLKGVVADSCYHGLGILVPSLSQEAISGRVLVKFLSGNRKGDLAHGSVRHQVGVTEPQGWVKIGLALSDVPLGDPVIFERRDRILRLDPVARISQRASLVRGFVKAASIRAVRRLGISARRPTEPAVVEYESAPGERIKAIVDSFGDPVNATAVVIPPAWGRTKETLWPLAATIIETFRKADQPVCIIRFDGTHRRGESFIPADLRHRGAEYLRFTFSRAVKDIHSTFEYLREAPELRPRRIILVTFSLSSVEGRRAVATDPTGLVGGWISVVGMVDLQSGLRTISGGIDFAYGLSRGVRFGLHELVGVVADMDHTGLDAIKHGLVFLEDARRDMANVTVPVTWIHGRHDAWMDVDRVRHLMSCGESANRRVIEVPTGHQLRTSAEAFSVFGLISSEIGRMAIGRSLTAATPDMAEIDQRQLTERQRLPKTQIELREFWGRYLLGRDARLGFQLLTATSAYRQFMRQQISELAISPSDRLLDLGSGTGDFAVQLAAEHNARGVRIDAVDFVEEALHRAAARISALRTNHTVQVSPVLHNIDPPSGSALPFRSSSYDGVLASLVISYISKPLRLLRAIRDVLKPDGRLVISTLKRDADISSLHVEGLEELRAGRAEEEFGRDAAELIDEIARNFLNDASRILDLEEEGTFRFWDFDELAALVRSAGFRVDKAFGVLGDPPQATLLVALRD